MVRNYNEGSGSSEPSHAVLLHCHLIEKILILPVYQDGNVAASMAWAETYANLAALAAPGTALAAVPVPDPTPLASPIEIVTTVLSVPAAGDNLGVHVLSRTKTGHVVPAVPGITGTDLGFSGAELTNWKWKGFVAERTDDDPDVIRVFAGLEKGGVRAGIGDQSTSANYIFSVKESDGSLVSPAALVSIDISFTPSQVTRGKPVVLKGGKKDTWWIIGRADSEFYTPQLPNTLRPDTSTKVMGVATSGSIAVWGTQDPSWLTWRRVRQVPTGVSHMPVQHLDNDSVVHHEAPRDLGLVYQELYQTLTPLTIDTDTGQDPVAEMAKLSIENVEISL